MTIFIDLDGTICTEEKTFERSCARPLQGAVESIRKLKDEGHTVVIYSARSWAELRMTEEWLKLHGVLYDAVQLGKPIASVWIDDRAIGHVDWDTTMMAIEGKKGNR